MKIDKTEKLNEFLSRIFVKDMLDVAIFRLDDGTLELFNKFKIEQKNECSWTVKKKTTFLEKQFSTLKNAVTWCIYEHRNNVHTTNKIEEIDRLLVMLESSIQLHKILIKKCNDYDTRMIYYAKLGDEEFKKQALLKELSKFITESKIYQISKFRKQN